MLPLWKEVNLAKIPVYYFTDESSELLVAVRKKFGYWFYRKENKRICYRYWDTENIIESFE